MNRRCLLFAGRNVKEILRDPINLFFGLGFPLVLLCLMSVINSNIPAQAGNTMFEIENLAPGIATFGPVFMALFSGMLLSKDRTSSFLMRLFTSPTSSANFILGYTLPMVLVALAQSIITFLAAVLLGLPFSVNIIVGVITTIPITVLFVAIGLLCGSVMSDKAVGGVCGALLTNLAGWLAGIWFPLDLVGGVFKNICKMLPFYHAAQATKYALSGDFRQILPHISVVLVYAAAFLLISIYVFMKKMNSDNS